MAREFDDVAYLRVAGILRADIASGRIPAGGRLPSETQLMIRHHVSRSVAKWAIAVLKADGLVIGHQGAGIFVRSPLRLVRRPQHPVAIESMPPDAVLDPADLWTSRTEEISADADLMRRLAVPLGTALLRTRYRLAGSQPLQLVTSWQATAAQRLAPEQLSERVIVRPARPEEIKALGLPARGCVLQISRTYAAKGVPIETADIVLTVDQVELHYELPAN